MHERNNNLASYWIQQASDQMTSSCSSFLWSLHHPSSFSFPSPCFSLVFFSCHGRSGLRSRSDHALYVREPANCHYSWIHGSENQASGLHMHKEEDREDPRGAEFKAKSTTERFLNCFTGKLQAMCVSASTVCQEKGITGAKAHHGLRNLNLFWNPLRFWILFEHAGFYTAECPRCTLLQEHKHYSFGILIRITSIFPSSNEKRSIW